MCHKLRDNNFWIYLLLMISTDVAQFNAEAAAWENEFGLEDGRKIVVPGLSDEYPNVACGLNDEVCLVTTGMGRKSSPLKKKGLLNWQ